VSVALDPNGLAVDTAGSVIISLQQNNDTPEDNGNLDGIEVQP
jgi:hypothetical protein